MKLTTLFKPDYARYGGLSPVRVHLMRLGFVCTSWAGRACRNCDRNSRTF
jgi:hypothetical protein